MMPRAASRACVRFDRLSQFVMLDAFAWRDASTSSAVHESCRDTVHDATVGRMDRLLDATHELPAPESRYSAARSFGARRPAHGVPSLTMASESRRRPSPKSASPRSRCRPRTRRLGGADDDGHAVCDLLELGEFVQKGSRANEVRHDGRPVEACGAGRRWICRLFVHGRSGDGPSAGTGGAGGGGLAHSSFTRTTT